MSRDDVLGRSALAPLHDQYPYWPSIPKRGLFIDERPALTNMDTAKIGDFVLLTVRDPLCSYERDPAEELAARLDNVELAGRSGMFALYTGTYKGARITIASGGSGAPEAELVLHELMEFTDAHTYLRVGGSAGVGSDVYPGDVVIASGAMREEAMTRAYIDASFPAVSHYAVVGAMAQAAQDSGARYHVGITVSVDSDFVGVGRPGVGGYLQPRNIERLATWNRAGIRNSDRESSAVITMAALFGFRGGSVCSVADNVVEGRQFTSGAGHHSAVDIALEGCAVLQRMDEKAAAQGSTRWLPIMGC